MKRRLQRIFWVLLFLCVWTKPGDCPAGTGGGSATQNILKKNGITRFVLPNGLSVVLAENHAAPVVAFQMWVNVGSRYEREDQAGISHVFEHMLFKGTARRGVGEIAREVEAAGGNINAYTSFDQTVYHLTLASRYFDVGLDVIADAIQHSSFDPKELAREEEVILEEFKRSEDIPERVVSRRLFERAYTRHPYRRPVIGYVKTFKKLTRKQILDYFHAWYVPNNMSLIVVGDFDSGEVIPKIIRAFRDFAPKPGIQLKVPTEPEQKEIRTTVTRRESSQALIDIGYHIPGIRDPENPAWDLLGAILGQGKTSRLYRKVKRKKELVDSISSYAYTPVDPGLFMISARLDPSRIESALEAILREVEQLRSEPPTEEELNRARVNIESDFIYSRETVQGQARRLGASEADFNDPFHQEVYLRGIESATPGEIRELADRYLRPENMTVSLLLAPDQRPGLSAQELEKTLARISCKVEEGKKSAPEGETILPEKVTLANGIRLIIKENHAVPTVSVQVAFPGGGRYENENNNGIYHFIASMLDRGTTRRTAEEISTAIEEMAGSLSGFSGRNSFGADLTILSRSFSRGMDLLADVVLHPSFDPSETEKVRKDILAAIRQEDDRLFRRVANLFRKTLYTSHPYRLRLLGEKKTVSRFSPDDLRKTYDDSISPDRMVIAVVGDIRKNEVIETVQRLFGGMKKRSIPVPSIPRETAQKTIRKNVEVVNRRQAHMIIGFQGTTVTSKDRFPLDVLSNVLAGQGGRLFIDLRDKKSLAYVVTAFSQEGVDPGFFAAYIGCSPEKLDEARKEILAELRRIREEKVSGKELKRSKTNLIGTFEIGLQTNSDMASVMSLDELYGNGYDAYRHYADRIGKVTADDVLRVARKYLDLTRYSMAVVRPGTPQTGGGNQRR